MKRLVCLLIHPFAFVIAFLSNRKTDVRGGLLDVHEALCFNLLEFGEGMPIDR
jgi:hypothetical protein